MLTRRECLKGISAGAGFLFVPVSIYAQTVVGRKDNASFVLDATMSGDGSTYVLDAIDITLDQSHVTGAKTFVVRADVLRIASTISLPGQNVTLLAREVICGPGAKIITKAPPPEKSFTKVTAASGAKPGDSGAPGRNGDNGLDGGAVTLYAQSFEGTLTIDSSGASGGDAENGGPGARGKNGLDAHGMTAGGDAGQGGQGGPAGTPGNGGNGGNVSVYILSVDGAFPSIAHITTGGDPGATAQNGAPGGPGTPGKGTTYYQHQKVPCPET